MAFNMYPGSDDSARGDKLRFTPVLTRFLTKRIEIDLEFENPEEISKGSQRLDMLEIKVTDNSLFVDTQGMPLEQGT